MAIGDFSFSTLLLLPSMANSDGRARDIDWQPGPMAPASSPPPRTIPRGFGESFRIPNRQLITLNAPCLGNSRLGSYLRSHLLANRHTEAFSYALDQRDPIY